jgi:translocation and assembly module TamA
LSQLAGESAPSPNMSARAMALALLLLATPQLWAQEPLPVPEIKISGASGSLTENILSHLDVSGEACSSSQRRLDRLKPDVVQGINRASQALGYYQVTHTMAFSAEQPCWSLAINLDVGVPVRFGAIDIAIAPTPDASYEESAAITAIIKASEVKSGAELNHAAYEDLKSELSASAVENGYFGARFTRSELAIDLERNIADVHIEFDPGVRYRFGVITIDPVEGLSGDFVRRFLPIDEGTPYSTNRLIELRQNLNDSQYFSTVTVFPQLDASRLGSATNTSVPLTVSLEPRLRRAWSAGVGATTDIGPRVRLAYEDRYLNKQGHRLNGDISISAVEQEPKLSYVIPLQNPSEDSISLNAGYLGQRNDTYDSDTYQVGTNYRTRVDFPWLGDDWLQNIFVNFQREESLLNEVTKLSNLTVGGISWSVTRADDPIFPTQGWRLFSQVSGASNSVLSDITFLQLYGSAKVVQSFGSSRVLLRGEAATTYVDALTELPVSLRYFTGGDQSVRGYQYESVGALNNAGELVGGKHMITASIEYDFPLREGWRGAIFHDAGNSFTDFSQITLKRSIGFGVRWRSPIGAIRADLASGIGDNSFRLHITMGPDL